MAVELRGGFQPRASGEPPTSPPPKPPAPLSGGTAAVATIERSAPGAVYALWREGDLWDGTMDELVSLHRSLAGAQRAHLDDAWPLVGPRGGKRPPRPDVHWWFDEREPRTWQPSDGTDYRIERVTVAD